jgi:hypothetical protein
MRANNSKAITYWADGMVTYQLIGYGLRPEPSACEWIVPGFCHEHE